MKEQSPMIKLFQISTQKAPTQKDSYTKRQDLSVIIRSDEFPGKIEFRFTGVF